LWFAAIPLFAALQFNAIGAPDAPPAAAPPPPVKSAPLVTNAYAGDESCRACHQNQVNSYHHTAHYFTSSLPTKDSIKGKFSAGSNVLKTLNTNLVFEMDAAGRDFTQTATLQVTPTEKIHRTEKFGVVVGSGRKGQTYLFWEGDLLFQLPISYWTEVDEWVNSPGYPDGSAIFTRAVGPRCLECHATTFVSTPPPANRYQPARLVTGITCEKCHGPGREHIARYQSKTPPKSPANGAIINPARLARDRQIDVCALCHAGGNPRALEPPLSFVPGGVLEDFVAIPKPSAETRVDVHGGHVQLLKRSRCYQSSTNMTCSTCHDVHAPQRDLAPYAAKCLACHKIADCGKFATLGHAIDQQCVVCHMPLQPTVQIISSANGKQLQPKVRNHQIAIYKDVQLPR
jgi:hypothetical protein